MWLLISLFAYVVALIGGMAWWAGRSRRAERSYQDACELEALQHSGGGGIEE